jgi:hypothetical protein
MSLAGIYLDLWRTAQETGQDASRELHGGAKLAVRVKDGIVTLTIARKTKRVGVEELKTFRRDCGVPADAARYPVEDQATRKDDAGALWYFVTYRWAEGASE